MDKEYIEQITIANMATNFPDIDVSVVRDYMTGRTPKISCNYGEPKPMTHADSIRAMSDEELANLVTDDMCELLCGAPLVCEGQCKQKMLDWLRQEAKDD
jgi:hypothetical protein